ncbi:MAG: FecR domain-containing protein, partial [Candidatus Cloacimonetes bacterium]|nr:FecR domain-containing protein [Candidatus Cloacimonadota bacterium]
MKRILLISVILLLATALLADSVAILSASKGKVSLERALKNLKFKNGELLQNKDVLRTGAESFAAYKYIDASSMIKLFSNSVVTVNASKEGGKLSKKVNVTKGSILTQVKKGSGTFTVQTPT